jgi:hypothetical protein
MSVLAVYGNESVSPLKWRKGQEACSEDEVLCFAVKEVDGTEHEWVKLKDLLT